MWFSRFIWKLFFNTQPVNINVGHVFLGLSATGLVWYEKLRNVRDQLISPHIPNIAPPSEHFYMKLG
jgi:hypothetical protein